MTKRYFQTPIMHRAVKHNGQVFLGGIVAKDTSVNVEGQTRQILETMEEYLTEAGSSRDHVLSATIYLTDISTKKEMDIAWKDFFNEEHLPARATVGVSDLGAPEMKLELSVIAAEA